MTTSGQIIEQFKRDWAAGQRPSVDAVLASIPDRKQREDARRQLEDYLAEAPTPAYPASTLAALATSDPVQRAAAVFDTADEPLGALMHRLRWERQIRLEQLTDELIDELKLPPKPAKVKSYLHDLEHGLLDPLPLSEKLLAALASLLGTTAGRLRSAATSWTRQAPPGDPQYQRSYEDQPPFSEVPPGYEPEPDTDAERDEIDRLFGGR